MPRLPALRAAALVAVVGLIAPCLAQEGAKPFMTFEHRGLPSMLVDARDAPLRDALAMIPARVGELPAEIDDMPPEAAGFIKLLLTTIARPARVGIVYDGDNPSGGFFGYGFIASVQCASEAEAEQLRDTVLAIADQIAEEKNVVIPLEASSRFEGMSEMMLPFGLLSFGPRKSDSGWRYEIVVGTMNDADAAFHAAPSLIEERGFEPFATATMDFSAATPLARMVSNLAGANAPQAGEFLAQFERMGLLGEDALRLEYEAGYTVDAAMQKFAIRGAAAHAEALSLSTEPLTSADLRAVPADAFGVMLGKTSFASIDRALEQMSQQGLPVADALAEFQRQTGVDLVEDVLHALGGTAALYNADSTGGGSLLSAVAMIGVRDHERFNAAMHRLTGVANRAIQDSGDQGRYIRLESWSPEKGAELISLRFPGLPVPFEVTLALTDKWFIAALTPQAAAAAAMQVLGHGDDGLGANPRFREAFGAHGEGAVSVTFVDTPRTIGDGYAFLSLAASAITNMVRSPHDPAERDPGMILPLYRDLTGGSVRPSIKIARWEGDDLVSTSWGDRSMWVQAGGEMGVASSALPLLAAGIGIAAIAGNENRLGWLDAPHGPTMLLESARRTVLLDPVSAMSASVIAVSEARTNSALKLPGWPAAPR